MYLGSIPGEASIPSAQDIPDKTSHRRFHSGRKALAHANVARLNGMKDNRSRQLPEHPSQFDGFSNAKAM